MNAVNFMRYLKGYVTFKGDGGFTERFINLTSKNNIFIWDIQYNTNSLKGKCLCRDYSKLRDISKKSGVKVTLIDKTGLYFDLKAKKERSGLLVGAVFFLLFFGIMSRFVWCIDVIGNTHIPKEDILIFAETYGLYRGTYKPNFDEVTIANTLAADSDGTLSWAAINIKGSRAVIEVREQKESIKSAEVEAPCNLIADFDGVIISAEILSGTGYITNGMGVKTGDLLISGAEENEDMSASFVCAEGKITALREKNYRMMFNSDGKLKKIKTAKKSYTLYLFGLKIPLPPFKINNSTCFSDEAHLSYNGVQLPIGVIVRTYYDTEEAAKNKNEALLSSLEEFSESAYKLNRNTLILTEDISVVTNKGKITIENNWKCLDFIGRKQEILTEN